MSRTIIKHRLIKWMRDNPQPPEADRKALMPAAAKALGVPKIDPSVFYRCAKETWGVRQQQDHSRKPSNAPARGTALDIFRAWWAGLDEETKASPSRDKTAAWRRFDKAHPGVTKQYYFMKLWKRALHEESKPARSPRTNAEPAGPVVSALRDENAFLRWWNLGERSGWIERLLRELNQEHPQ